MALRAIHMVEPAEDRKALGHLCLLITEHIGPSIHAFHLRGCEPLGDHADGAECDVELKLELPPCITLRHTLQECESALEMRQGFLVGSPLEGMCASAAPVLYRLWIQARLGVVMRQEHRLAICLLGKVLSMMRATR